MELRHIVLVGWLGIPFLVVNEALRRGVELVEFDALEATQQQHWNK